MCEQHYSSLIPVVVQYSYREVERERGCVCLLIVGPLVDISKDRVGGLHACEGVVGIFTLGTESLRFLTVALYSTVASAD